MLLNILEDTVMKAVSICRQLKQFFKFIRQDDRRKSFMRDEVVDS